MLWKVCNDTFLVIVAALTFVFFSFSLEFSVVKNRPLYFVKFALLLEPRLLQTASNLINPTLLSYAGNDMLDYPLLLFGGPLAALGATNP